MPLGFLLRLPAMALEPFCVGGEIVLRRLGQLLRPGDGPPRGGDLRVDKADDVQPVRHRRYSTLRRVRCDGPSKRTRPWDAANGGSPIDALKSPSPVLALPHLRPEKLRT